MRHIAIRLLGPFQVTIDGAVVASFEYAKVRALLAYLATGERRPHPRAELATLLWPDQPERSARASLSQALTTLRNALGDKNADSPLLIADTHSVQLAPTYTVAVDVAEFLAILGAAEKHVHRSWRTCAICFENLQHALGLYRGNFLGDLFIADSDVFEEWVSLQREHLLQRALTALERLAEQAQWRGAYSVAVSYVQRLVMLEPLLETNQRSLMHLLALNGERAAALAQYKQLQAMLLRELGTEPEEATTALFNQITRSNTLDEKVSAPPYIVPLPPTPLVGRDEELGAISAQFRDTSTRVMTITGTGGIGKTRLAMQVAETLRYDFEDGVYFVELAALSDAALVVDAIARTLGVQERPHQSISETLRLYLRGKQLLLIIDNFEHVVDAASLVSELLAACPALTLLVTSRVPLNIRAEQLFILQPLADPDAVQLFVERAQGAGAVLDEDTASTTIYAAICHRLDRLPLAIELIAVRARTLAPLELLHQLEQPLQALVRGPRDLLTRHQSLRHAIRWSYDLLDTEEQRVFRYLGVFTGGCTIEAAQVILGPTLPVVSILETLTQASLLQRQGIANQTRFLFLETIREFAFEQLTLHNEAEDAHQRHAKHFADFSMAAYVELLRPDAPRWRAWVAADYDNIRAAFHWALAHQMYETALRLATGIWRFHLMAGNLREGLERLEAALTYREQAPLEVQCNALRAAGTLANCLNDYARARHWLEAAVEAAWRLGDQKALQPVLTNLGAALLEQGELDDARVHLEVSLSLAQRGEDPTIAKFPLGYLAELHLRMGDYAQAQTLGEESLRINRERQDPEGTANALFRVGMIMLAQGNTLRAQEIGEEALALHRVLNHQLGMGQDFTLLGGIRRSEGNYADALVQYQQCLTLWRERGNIVTSAFVLDSVAQTLSQLDDYARAVTLISAASAIHIRASVRLAASERAARNDTLHTCRTSLDDATFTAAWATGRQLSLAQAIDLALQPLTAVNAVAP